MDKETRCLVQKLDLSAPFLPLFLVQNMDTYLDMPSIQGIYGVKAVISKAVQAVRRHLNIGGRYGGMGIQGMGMVVRGVARVRLLMRCCPGWRPHQSYRMLARPLRNGPNAPDSAKGEAARGLLCNFRFQGES